MSIFLGAVNTDTKALSKYPADVKKQYKEYLKVWGKDFAESYLERQETIDEKEGKDSSLDRKVYDALILAKNNAAKQMKAKKYGADKYNQIVEYNIKIELNKLGKITDKQLITMFNKESIKTIWQEQKYIMDIFNKKKK